MSHKLLTQLQAAEKCGIGRTKFKELQAAGVLPAAQYLPGCTRPLFLESKLDDAIEKNLQDEMPGEVTA